MDEDSIKKTGIKPLVEIIHEIAGIFPTEEATIVKRTPIEAIDNEDIANTVEFLYKIGITSLVSVGVGADDKDPDTVVVQASPPWRIGLPAKDYYEDASVVEKYQSTLSHVLAALYPNLTGESAVLHGKWKQVNGHGNIASRGKSEDYAKAVVEFEQKLAAASPDAEDSNDVTVTLATNLVVILLIHYTRNIITQCP